MNLTDEQKRQMWEELIAPLRQKSRGDYPQPNITAMEMANLSGITHAAAYARLRRGVEEGIYGRSEGKVRIEEDQIAVVFWLK